MKKRNTKILSFMLLSCMTLVSMPVGLSAKSTNSYNKEISVVQGTEVNTQKGLVFNMAFKAGELQRGTKFEIQAKDFDLDRRAYNGIKIQGATVTYQSGNSLKVEIDKTSKETTISIPVYGTVLKGTPRLIVEGEDSVATPGEYIIGRNEQVDRYGLTVTTGQVPNISDTANGQLADIIIEEKAAGTLVSGTKIRLRLPSATNLKFRLPDTDSKGYATSIKVEGLRGLSSENIKVKAEYIGNNSNELLLTLVGIQPSIARGGIQIKGLECQVDNKNSQVGYGPVQATIRLDDADTTTLIVANVSGEGINLKVKQPIKLTAGKGSQTVEVTMSENVAGSLSRRNDVYFEVKGAKIVPGSLKMIGSTAVTIKEEMGAKGKEVTGFTVDTRKIDPTRINTVTFSFDVQAEAGTEGPIELIADSMKLEEKVTIGQVGSALAVTMNTINLKPALKDQVGGSITIREMSSGIFERGSQLVVSIGRGARGISFTDAKVEVEDMKLGNMKVENGSIILDIDRGSDEGATIRLTDLEMYVDALVEEGTYDIVLSGSAVSDNEKDRIVLKDKIKVAKQANSNNQQESNGLAKGTASFKIGERNYIVNDKVKEMDAAPYLSSSSRVMVPVKYVSDAFGITEDKMHFDKEDGKSVVIIEAGERTLKLIDGSNLAEVNNVVKPMDDKVTILNGRTYVPVGEMARMLDIDVEWSNETKKAIFTNK